ncbi:hypothetical protein SNE40_015873 [Patella caerulea]|uniref:Uncharacterized protein n=1 Tax=Patella caerulea TaxID=87958 RepID=A0AAN8JBM7_PATCE
MKRTNEELNQLIFSYGQDLNGNTNELETSVIRNGLVLFLFHKNNDDVKSTTRHLKAIAETNGISLVQEKLLKTRVTRIVKKVKAYKHIDRDWNCIKDFFLKVAVVYCDVNTPDSLAPPIVPDIPDLPRLVVVDSGSDAFENAADPDTCRAITSEAQPLPSTSSATGVDVCLRGDCAKCKQHRKSLRSLAALKSKYYKLLSRRKTPDHHLRQALDRKKNIENRLRAERIQVKSKFLKADGGPKKVIKKQKCNKPRNKLQTISLWELNALKRRVAVLESENEKLRAENERVTCVNDDLKNSSSNVIKAKKDGKTFSYSYRKAAYACLVNQVPVETAGSLISKVVKEMTGNTVDYSADASTISQMAYELSVLDDVHVGEAMVKGGDLNLAWDATSLDGEHINEVHINLSVDPPKSLILQIDSLSGGKACDYVDHISRSIQDVTETYASYSDIDPRNVHENVLQKLKSTLGDRVPTNRCVRNQLQELLDIQLLDLKCNVHPLDGLASEARKTLKKFDSEQQVKGQCYGKDCGAVNLVMGLSKIRYKNGVGDPKGFREFMRTHNIRNSMLPRYVGNRMHVMFHLAGAYFHLKDKILNVYFKDFSNCTSSFKPAVIKDLQNSNFILQLKALGLMGKILTGPWMKVLYGNADKLSNLQAVPTLKKLMEKIHSLRDDPMSVLTAKYDAFGRPLDSADEVLQSLQAELLDEAYFEQVTLKLLECSITVLERQMESYLTGELSSYS